PVENHEDEMSCALSTMNFRKLREIGCRLSQDPHTRECVARMRAELDKYEEESRRGMAAKTDQSPLNYTFKVPPLGEHQVRGFRFLHSMDTPALFGDVGSGKTFIVSTWIDSLVKAGEPIAAIVVCPVNLIEHVWVEQVSQFTDLKAVSLREPTYPVVLAEDYDDEGDPEERLARAKLRAERKLDPEWQKRARLRAQRRHSQLIEARFNQTADVYVVN